jgi:hypothetical protein
MQTGESMASKIIFALAAADLTGKRGYAVETASGLVSIVNAATDKPLGILTTGGTVSEGNSVALPGTIVKVKLAATPGTVVLGTPLVLDGTSLGALKAQTVTTGGSPTLVARALESGAADELIDALVLEPVAY